MRTGTGSASRVLGFWVAQEGLDWFRTRFQRDAEGMGEELQGLYLDGRADLNARDASDRQVFSRK